MRSDRVRSVAEMNPDFLRGFRRRRGGLLAGLRAALGWLRTAFDVRGWS